MEIIKSGHREKTNMYIIDNNCLEEEKNTLENKIKAVANHLGKLKAANLRLRNFKIYHDKSLDECGSFQQSKQLKMIGLIS